MNDASRLTPLNGLHHRLGGKMVAFAGYQMPLQFTSGIIKEHQHTRKYAGLFDVSHMGQIAIKGKQAERALESLMPVNLSDLAAYHQCYGLLTNETGGVRDDLMISRVGGDEFRIVVNAACKETDIAYLHHRIGDRVEIVELADHALIALQGPQARQALCSVLPQMAELAFMRLLALDSDFGTLLISCSGYTGEDGFEISVAAEHAVELSEQLLAIDNVRMIGLGARDSLRLEAGMCLYGHELSPTISPIEANLRWAIASSRRASGKRAGGFPGAERILKEMADGVCRKRIGLRASERVMLRQGTLITRADGDRVGMISSGGFSPSLGYSIAHGMVKVECLEEKVTLYASIRNKPIQLEVCSLPFVHNNYHR